jgi:hypothetical protein
MSRFIVIPFVFAADNLPRAIISESTDELVDVTPAAIRLRKYSEPLITTSQPSRRATLIWRVEVSVLQASGLAGTRSQQPPRSLDR